MGNSLVEFLLTFLNNFYMKKTIIQVPKGIRYFNKFEENYGFHLEDYPYILDKKLPGCGFTTWVLTNKDNVILASPRKMLMENKKEQIGSSVYLVKGSEIDSLNVDKDLNKFSKLESQIEKKAEENGNISDLNFDKEEFDNNLTAYITDCIKNNLPIKFIVTYDSYRKVKEYLEARNMFSHFFTVVDEFQSIFTDSRFKSSTELEFLSVLENVQKVCFVSATPMMESYLKMIPFFENMPYHELDWFTLDPNRIKKPHVDERSLRSVNLAAKAIIEPYRKGNFPSKLYIDPETGEKRNVESREAVIYINSVTNIIGIIKACNLKPEEVNILCSDTTNNAAKIKNRLNNKKKGLVYKIGKVPTKKEPRKMITLCTRTVYLGADFYSDNARSFIISDANIDTLAVDITLDLPQILGRQRLDENPWKDDIVIYIKPLLRVNAISYEEYMKVLNDKIKKTENLLKTYETAPDEAKSDILEVYSDRARDYNYKKDYVAINKHAGSSPIPVRNDLVILAEHRAFEIQQLDFASRTSVFSRMVEEGNVVTTANEYKVKHVIETFDSLKGGTEKIKYLCNLDVDLNESELEEVFLSVPDMFRNFYLGLGPDRCKALGYNYTSLKKEYANKFFDTSKIDKEILNQFATGNKLSGKSIKETLQEIYNNLGYEKTAKATDLEKYFEIKKIKLKDQSGSWVHGFELLKKKKV